MLQRIQSVWMTLTVALVCIVLFMPVISFSTAGADFRLMTYGIRGVTGELLVGGELSATPILSVCVTVLLAISALVPLVAIFFYKRRQVQTRLLGAEFILLIGSAGFVGYYIWTYWQVVAEYSDNYFISFFPLVLVVAMLANWFAIKGVIRDEILVRAADRIR
jgi:uncharacterized membrane protein